MATILGANTLSSAYDVANGVRFEDGDNAKMSRSISGSPTDPEKYTFSCWIKRGNLTEGVILGEYANANFRAKFGFDSNHKLEYYQVNDGSASASVVTTQVFRDTTAWYHLVLAYDSSQGSAADRVKFYVNGTVVSSYSGTSYPAQDLDSRLNQASQTLVIGQDGNDGKDFDGYMCELVLIDGQALDATSFGQFDSDTPTTWKPKDPSSLTFGDDGFYLDFEDSGDLDDDESGQGNDFTAANLAATDQVTDTCTNNFCVFNPLVAQSHVFSEGNLKYTSSSSDWDSGIGSIGFSAGKWYVEQKITAVVGGIVRSGLGMCDARDIALIAENEFGYQPGGTLGDSIGYNDNAVHKNDSSQSGSWGDQDNGDVVQMAVDADNSAVYFGLNGTWGNSGDPTSGASKTGGVTFTAGQTYITGAIGYGGSAVEQNWGNPVSALSSGNADANGYGNFEYAPPTGYYALCTKNLAEYG